ncbi:MAG: hypothetical protein CL916_00900 [Deltaproteobacteria bacterium]|nr:hypothetical protein [Deltaproteobacteria bacterium]
MWKNIVALAFLILSVRVLLDGVSPASASLGPMVVSGSNPIVSKGGSRTHNAAEETLFTAPSDQLLIITDIDFTVYYGNSGCYPTLKTSSGDILGKWFVREDENMVISKSSGLIIPAGESLILSGTCGHSYNNLYYAISGHYAVQ